MFENECVVLVVYYLSLVSRAFGVMANRSKPITKG